MTAMAEQPIETFTVPPQGEFRLACALLGTSLAQSHRIADIAPRITSVATDLRRLCEEAMGADGDDQQADLLVAAIVGRWVLTACGLTWLDVETGFDRL
jgi:hypothetical protein